MVTKKDIKGLQFNDIYDYFDYIIDSKVNGLHSQFVELLEKMSRPQKIAFYEYIDNNHFDTEIREKIIKYLI